MNSLAAKLIARGVPAVVGMGLACVAVRVIKNEAHLVIRQLELQDALVTSSWEEKRRLLRGHKSNNNSRSLS